MKERVISGVTIAVILIVVWLFFFKSIVFDLFFAVLAAMACFELTRCIGLKNKYVQAVAIVFAFAWVLGIAYPSRIPMSALVILFVIFVCLMAVMNYPEIEFQHIAGTIYAAVVVPTAFAMCPVIGDLYKTYEFLDLRECQFFVWYVVASSLFTDVFAQLSGMAFGKHKVTPKLSEKKTLEGCIGGIVVVFFLNLLWYFLYVHFFATKPFGVPLWFYCLMSPFMSVASMFGDLTASLIKRNYNIKDYSKLIPGHGGIMDRFDSVIMVLPMFYAFIAIFGSVGV
ncbi:MAG: CDP-archaeol synthase [Clostridia bacterium]|nr:CDP-archaeol synthase [Clostridia bacterium]MBQ2091714.1 CDP-archaeol synthase [Clostridia bacterium]